MRIPCLIAVCAAGLVAAPAFAQLTPTFSVDFQGPTVTLGVLDGFGFAPITEGDILTTAPPGPASAPNPPLPGPLPPPGIEIGALPGSPGAVPGGLGILPGVFGHLELDALSYGRDVGVVLYFSVDEFASGVGSPAPPNVFSEGSVGALEASADVFRYLGAFVPTPGPAPIGNTAATDGDGLAPSGLPGVGFAEPNVPNPAVLPDVGDNLDAVDVNTTAADLVGPIFFSLDEDFPDILEPFPPVNSGTALALGASGADVLVTFAGGAPVIAIPGPALGLDVVAGPGTDDLDALIYNDADGTLTLTPPDAIYFSVRRGSAVIGVPDSAFGIPIEEGDVLTLPTGVGLPPALFISAESLGLATVRSGLTNPFGLGDELDALDILPAPKATPGVPIAVLPVVAGLLAGFGIAALRRWQRTA